MISKICLSIYVYYQVFTFLSRKHEKLPEYHVFHLLRYLSREFQVLSRQKVFRCTKSDTADFRAFRSLSCKLKKIGNFKRDQIILFFNKSDI
jgi:hypothetical protein